MKSKNAGHLGVQEICRKLKIQLEELAVTLEDTASASLDRDEKARRVKLMEQLKNQLAELSR